MANIQMNRGTKAEIDNTPITDGLISFDTDNNYIYLDNEGSREFYGGIKVVPNPEEEPTEVLRNIQVGEDVYKISGGHEIQNDAGDTLTQRDVMQFEGVYAYDDDTEGDEKTKISIVREFQSVAEIEALTGEAKKGFEVIEDTEEYIPYTGSDILFDNTDTSFEGENVQEVLEEVDERIDDVSTPVDISSQIVFNETYIDTSSSNTVIRAYKIGKMVIVNVNGLSLKSALSSTVSIMSGLPVPKDVLNVGLANAISGSTSVDGWNTSRYRLNTLGELQLWYDNVPQTSVPFGQFIYFTN